MSLTDTQNGQSKAQSASGSLPPPRQIRFVSTDGQPHAKRRRINAACLTCRKRKTRCSGERPECSTCTRNGHECSGYIDRSNREEDSRVEDNDDEELEFDVPRTHTKDVEASIGSHGSTIQPEREPRNAVDDIKSPASNYTSTSFTSSRNRVPYFRYFGPTAIVPGFKQMVVELKGHRASLHSAADDSPATGLPITAPAPTINDRDPILVPFYDATDPNPVAPLILHLCETFFVHLGCNYPFLQRRRFLRDLEDKKVDAILVDAVCAVAARFSSDPSLHNSNEPSMPLDAEGNVLQAFRGHPFAQHAMSAVVDTFSCPTIAVAQACLLLAYEEFGTDHDSGLWMYLGTAIRMAQDLGIQKLEGMQLEGRIGPTPKTVKHGQDGKIEEQRRFEQQQRLSETLPQASKSELEDRSASEQERIDTFWAIFFLDRAVSSGVGRPVTLRDKDIEISFPYRADDTTVGGHPDPFPAMIQIVHMYGRVADVLNNIKHVSQVTPDVLKRLASMERDLTGFYQRLSTKLHFNATNFQAYVKAGHGTNFILLHFWFHTLIVLVHQPTLLHSFEGRIQQLFPDSRELSMSSAKTIADILAFAELIDVKSFIGNPFTSQPMYVAACAFLAEASAHASQPPSRATSPRPAGHTFAPKQNMGVQKAHNAASARHTLLATAANQNYQRCYKALQTLNSYWGGCRYILTALDQKSKGLMDPLLFTADDVDGEMPSTTPSFTSPGWRRRSSLAASLEADARLRSLRGQSRGMSTSPPIDLSHAIGWSLTGTANSPAPNLSFLYSMMNDNGRGPSLAGRSQLEPNGPGKLHHTADRTRAQAHGANLGPLAADSLPQTEQLGQASQVAIPMDTDRLTSLPIDPVSAADADLLLGLHSPYTPVSGTAENGAISMPQLQASGIPNSDAQLAPGFEHVMNPQQQLLDVQTQDWDNMLIRAQDIDMSGAQQFDFAFPGGEMIPWLEYLPQDVLTYFEDQQTNGDMMDSAGSFEPG
ncbi:hypothetical protein H2200_009558 [Cladophialophora chaetospira]|uniref:Zn(2)-C6 fungal-type domain-containing protein n=1 Tax=Cladophialophora chaetospira TaxID=386627 RepID=A0AA38X2R6_9EURO|nr:hypothetical protein H2200_009558 [Cladophialophora chaetospira]